MNYFYSGAGVICGTYIMKRAHRLLCIRTEEWLQDECYYLTASWPRPCAAPRPAPPWQADPSAGTLGCMVPMSGGRGARGESPKPGQHYTSEELLFPKRRARVYSGLAWKWGHGQRRKVFACDQRLKWNITVGGDKCCQSHWVTCVSCPRCSTLATVVSFLTHSTETYFCGRVVVFFTWLRAFIQRLFQSTVNGPHYRQDSENIKLYTAGFNVQSCKICRKNKTACNYPQSQVWRPQKDVAGGQSFCSWDDCGGHQLLGFYIWV